METHTKINEAKTFAWPSTFGYCIVNNVLAIMGIKVMKVVKYRTCPFGGHSLLQVVRWKSLKLTPQEYAAKERPGKCQIKSEASVTLIWPASINSIPHPWLVNCCSPFDHWVRAHWQHWHTLPRSFYPFCWSALRFLHRLSMAYGGIHTWLALVC